MTTNDIDAIRARADAAEDGPWRVVEEHGRDIADEAYTRLTIQTDGPSRSREIAELVDPDHSWSSQLPEENAAFIAFARTLVPALCDEIEQLRAERDHYLDQLRNAEVDVRVLKRQLTEEDQQHSDTIADRDQYQEMADQLAEAIAKLTGVEIGEHSSMNNPWENALQAAAEAAERAGVSR